MKNSFKYILLIILNILLACSVDDSDYSEIDKSYIKFVHAGQNISFKPKNMRNKDGISKMLLLFDHDLYMQDISLITTFEILADGPVILSTGKTLGCIKIQNNMIEIYKSSPDYLNTELNIQSNLPSFLQIGVPYDIGFRKTNQGINFFLKGGDIEFEKYYGINDDFLQNVMRGKPFFEVTLGDVKVHKSILSADYNKLPKISVYGDSFIEGAIMNRYNLNFHNRWCIKLANYIGPKDCFIDGIGGERVSEKWLNRLKLENSWFKSEYVIFSIGTNNYKDVTEYINYMEQAIDYIKNNGQIPILVTVTPRPTFNYDSTVRVINDWVIASGEKYIDMHYAVTKNNDPSQWREEYVLPDGIHPSLAGYDAMYEQLKKDCPFLQLF